MYKLFEQRSVKSKQLFDRAMNVFVEGANSPSRGIASCKPYPIYIQEGKGGRVFDADGECIAPYFGRIKKPRTVACPGLLGAAGLLTNQQLSAALQRGRCAPT